MEDDLFGWSPAVRTPHYANERPVLSQGPTKVEWDDDNVIQTTAKNLVHGDMRNPISFEHPDVVGVITGYLRYICFSDSRDITLGITQSLGETEYFTYYKVMDDVEVVVYR